LFTWGYGGSGRLGDGTIISKSSPILIGANGKSSNSPTQIGSSSWTAVSAGGTHTAAIRSDNLLFTWGSNAYGQLGDGTTLQRNLPVQIGSNTWRIVSTGLSHTAAISFSRSLFTWGLGTSGQLGDGTSVSKSSPVQIGSSLWTAVSAGNLHTLAVLKG
jgi:alpha-tubulin suppressor-like RCC1 family protein